MELVHIVVCVIIGCAKLGSSIPYSDGNFGRNGHGTEWFMNQNFEGPQNEFNSQHFSMMNRNGGEFIPRHNFQSNIPTPTNNVPNNGYREVINVPNFNSVNKIEPNVGNQMNYHNFERRNVNAQAGAFAGQNYNQENIQVNKEIAEINQMIAQDLAAIEREKVRETSYQQNYVPNVAQRQQQTEQQQNYYPQNVHFGTQQPVMQSTRSEISIPVISQAPLQEQNVIRKQTAPIPPPTTTQQEGINVFTILYPDGRKEFVTDLDQFMKAHPNLTIQRRYNAPHLPIQQIPEYKQQTQQTMPQPQLQETSLKLTPKPDEQTSPQIQELELPKHVTQQSIVQKEVNVDKSSSSAQNDINKITLSKMLDTTTESPPTITLKPASVNYKPEEVVIPIPTAAIENMIKNVFENLNHKQTNTSTGNNEPQTSPTPQTPSTTEKPFKPFPKSERKIIDISWNPKQTNEPFKPVTQTPKTEGGTLSNNPHSKDGRPTTLNVVSPQIMTSQVISNNKQITISEKTIEKPSEETGNFKDDSSKKIEKIEKIVIPEIVFKIEDVNSQDKPNTQSDKIIVSEEVITVEPTKQEIEIQVAEFLEKTEGSKKPLIKEKIIINEMKPNDKKNKGKKSKKGRPIEEIVIKEEIYTEDYDDIEVDKKEKRVSKVDTRKMKGKVGGDKEKTTKVSQTNDTSKKTKEDKLKKNEKQRNKEKTGVNKEGLSDNQVKRDQPIIEEIIIREDIESPRRYNQQNNKIQSPQEDKPIIVEEIIQEQVAPEDDDQSMSPEWNNKQKEESQPNDKQQYKEEVTREEGESVEEGDSDYVKELKDSMRSEKLIRKEIIRNGETKGSEVKQEDGMTIITSNADEFYVEQVSNEELAKLEKELSTPDSKERPMLAKEAFVFRTPDTRIPENIKKEYKGSNKPIYLFQIVFPPIVDREVVTTIYPNGTVVEEVNEYLCELETERQEEMQKKNEGEDEEQTSDGNEERNTMKNRNTAEERKNVEEERKRKEKELKKREEARKRAEEERKKREDKRKKYEEERKRKEEENKRTEEEQKRSEEERKTTEGERKKSEEEGRNSENEHKKREEKRKRMEEERRKRESERKKIEEERIKKEERKKSEEERKKNMEERKMTEEERIKRVEERKKSVEERKKKVEERKMLEEKEEKNVDERKITEKHHKKRKEEQKRTEETRKNRKEEYKRTEEEHKKRKEEQKITEEEHKKRRERRRKSEEERKKREEEYKKKLEERKRKEEEEECDE